ncbi:MAG TPA: bifunctional adenosylcobinamide kinase/adenosylcobinamide-phosphate guanylyltransferase [Rhodospirillaceae bacterium]|nr:bifunctional adenosylcobinamide kinase/adenosylcobinamide-phosphate guanylyltransferase [Magnetovibrio sp.]HCS71532.1 bifunctional adenosylcobinamide kinase/adenosylcobinamide-phosphate guanylyltransferase [Rhodospirillaceae bacterium]|tara:strand:+ start:1308 stop:1841 length:534 start_codon:yes stop_codon:yes gene_type:complete
MNEFLPPVTLILGGQRSGKSRLAETLIEDAAGGGLYLATAEARDGEMTERIATHRARRGPDWETIEEPLDILGQIREHAAPGRPVLVDCVTLWLSNLMAAGRDAESEVETLARGLTGLAGPVVLVSNEVGLGVIPANALARSFADAAGLANQRLAACADRVVFTAAGLPLVLKGHPL